MPPSAWHARSPEYRKRVLEHRKAQYWIKKEQNRIKKRERDRSEEAKEKKNIRHRARYQIDKEYADSERERIRAYASANREKINERRRRARAKKSGRDYIEYTTNKPEGAEMEEDPLLHCIFCGLHTRFDDQQCKPCIDRIIDTWQILPDMNEFQLV